MQLKPEEISKVIRSQIKYYDNAIKQNETGTVLMVGDGIARASGLINCMAGELLEFEDGSFGMAQNLEENSVSIVLFGDDSGIGEGQTVKRTGKVVSVPVGEAMIGRVVNALGQPIDGAGPVATSEYRAIESPAPGICERQGVNQPLQTGIKAIDSMVPIGRGQRELIIGDRQTGKTTLAADTIINQKGKDVICIYVAIGQKRSTVSSMVETLSRNGAMDYTKRLSRYCKLNFIQVPDEKTPDKASDALNRQIKETEGNRLLSHIREQDYVIALAIDGKMLDSVELSDLIARLGVQGKSSIVFVIGGSLGLSDAVLKRADYKLSFSRMTFPHQLMQMILLEQIYRGYRIMNHEPYHK